MTATKDPRAPFVFALVAIAGLIAIVSPTDPDIFWHLANGRRILEVGFDPSDVFSFTAHGRPSIAHEWLFDVSSFAVMRAFGYRALVLASGVVQAITAALFVHLARRRRAGYPLSLVLTGLFLVLAAHTWGVRAQLVTDPFAGAFFLLLDRYREDPRRSRQLSWLVPLMLLWANLHASFPVGIALIAGFIVGALANRRLYGDAPERLPLSPLVVALAGCIVVTLANPRGLTLWTYPLPFLLADDPIVRTIEEWRPLDFRSGAGVALVVSLLALALVGLGRRAPPAAMRRGQALGRVRLDATDTGLVVAFAAMALRYGRMTPLFGMVALPIVGGALARAFPILSRRMEPMGARKADARPFVLVGVAIAALGVVMARSPAAQLGRTPLLSGRFSYPAAAADALARLPPARVFNEYAWGGFLLYTLYPHDSVFVDGRADLYRDGVMADYVAVSDLAPSYRTVLARDRVDCVLVLPGSPLATALRADPGFRVVLEDAVSILFARQAGS